MISQIGPLVQGESGRGSRLALHVLGGLFGGVMIGVALGTFGVLLHAAMPDALGRGMVVVVVPLAWIYFGASDTHLIRVPTLATERQTPKSWSCALGPTWAVYAWGFHLGLLVATRRPHQSALILPVYAVLAGNLWFSTMVMGLYGASKAIAVVAAVSLSKDQQFAETCDLINARAQPVQAMIGSATVLAGLLVLLGPHFLT